jgi:hypothetical protein
MKPKIVVMCGSSRFVDIMAVTEWVIERDELAITMGLNLLPKWYPDCPDHHLAEHENCAEEMDELHLRKIDLCDEIFVVDYLQYIGDSTARELSYAEKHGKRVRYFSRDIVGLQVLDMISGFAGKGVFLERIPAAPLLKNTKTGDFSGGIIFTEGVIPRTDFCKRNEVKG